MKSRSIVVAVSVVLAAAFGLTIVQVVRSFRSQGGGLGAIFGDTKAAIEQWCGKQLLVIANAHLRPELSFDQLQFEFPATATLTNVKLTDQNIAVVDAASMRIEFTETPKSGRPIVIQSVQLTDPVLRIIRREDGGFIGLSDMVEKPVRDSTEGGVSVKPSDIFAIRRIGFVNGSISLELPGQPPMVLDQLTFDLTTTPAENPAHKGWYTIAGKASRPSLFDWETQSRLNIDTAVWDIQKMTWQANLSADEYSVLPPELQKFARDHELAGDFAASLAGTLPLRSMADSVLDMQVGLTKGHIVLGKYVLPVKLLEATARMSGGMLSVKPVMLDSLGGTLQMDGTMTLSDEYPTTLNLNVQGMRIEQALRPIAEQQPKYAGRVDINGAMNADAAAIESTLHGRGNLAITEGRLMLVRPLAMINEMVAGKEAAESSNDTGKADWQLFGDRVTFTNMEVVSSATAARGAGDVMFDSTIKFHINAGPLERAQSALGRVGELVGKVTDKIVQYEITGTLREPMVTVKTLGLDLGLGK